MCPIYTGKERSLALKRRKLTLISFLNPIEEETKEKTAANYFEEVTIGCCSSDTTNHEDLLVNCKSSREVCICVLRNHGLLFNGEKEKNTHDSKEYDGKKEINSLKCKSCGTIGSSKKMLICDRFEEPYHLTCSGVFTKNVPFGNWYCHPCVRNKPKISLQKLILNGEKLNVNSKKLNPKNCKNNEYDSRRYMSSVRIGEEYQVEVEDWNGPICDDDNYFDDLREIDPAEFKQVPKVVKYVNWLQCKAEIKKGTICRKWRRAPFYEVQTIDWDCSCAVKWDAIHADCAVPQELETDAVLKELECIKSLRNKFNNRGKNLK